MKRVTFVLMCVCAATSFGTVIYDNPTGGTIWAWNWGDYTAHTVAEVDYAGNTVIQHTGVVSNTTGADVNARFGSKWDFTISGNTSANPADYTISFDLRNVSGNWDPIALNLAVVTPNPVAGAGQYGHGFATMNVAQADGWVHYEFNLADYVNDWWEGADWDLMQSTWSIEVGMPWPGVSVADGVSFTQVWEMDNLQVAIPEPATLSLLGLGALAMLRKRK